MCCPAEAHPADLQGELPRALADGQLYLEYQPLFSLATGGIVAAEALLRWRHPAGGVLPPGAFLPQAEQNGLILEVGSWALAAACRQRRRWLEAGLPPVPVAVNLSPVQLAEAGFADQVLELLAELALPAHLLELELTESRLLGETATARRAVQRLAEAGVRFALDDFGTGYSSLRALQTLPVHRLKIAREFLQEATRRPADAAIVRSVIELGHHLGLTVTAEGVERPEQLALLRRLGCDEAQGFHLSHPLAPGELAARLGAKRG